VGLFDTSGGGGAFTGVLLSELFSGHFGSGLLSGGQFCSGHFSFFLLYVDI
jgi:hypothetical protein